VETRVVHKAQAHAQEPLYVCSQVLEVDDKRVRLLHGLHRRSDDELVASAEQLYLHVDTAAGKAAPFEPALRERLGALRAASG